MNYLGSVGGKIKKKKIVNRGRGAEFAKNHGRNSRDDDPNGTGCTLKRVLFLFFHFKVEL